MIGPNKWEDLGPGAAIGGGERSQREVGARNVGHMIPDKSAGVTPQVRSDGTASKLSIRPR